MARPYPSDTLQPKGLLEIFEIGTGFYQVSFTPPVEALPRHSQNPKDYRRPIFEINHSEKRVTIYPYKVWGVQPMDARYYQLVSISFDLEWYVESYVPDISNVEEFLSNVLPPSFIEDYNYGLGFRKAYKFIVSMLEGFGVKELHISEEGFTKIDPQSNSATIKRSDLGKMCKRIDSITQRAQRVSATFKRDAVTELFSHLITNENSKNKSTIANADLTKQLGLSTRFVEGGASKKEQLDAMEVLRKNGRKIIYEQREELMKLRNDIELVALEELIYRFESTLNNKQPESYWQKLINENPFILNMALGVPIIKVLGQATVGGRGLSGSGDKIADFLVRNTITNNAAIVEIKTPSTRLVNSKEYRGGVYAPSTEMTAAVNQLLDQIFQFQKEINSLKAASKEYNLESYSVTGILIAGTCPVDANEQKSFELFRGNSKNIQIIAFNELLWKLKSLHTFLNPSNTIQSSSTDIKAENISEDLPF